MDTCFISLIVFFFYLAMCPILVWFTLTLTLLNHLKVSKLVSLLATVK